MSKGENKEKLRVYEYAKSLNMSSKEIITILKRLNISVNNHMSVMENEAVEAVEKFFRDIKANAAAKRASEEQAAISSAPSTPKKQGEKPLAGEQKERSNQSSRQGQQNQQTRRKTGTTASSNAGQGQRAGMGGQRDSKPQQSTPKSQQDNRNQRGRQDSGAGRTAQASGANRPGGQANRPAGRNFDGKLPKSNAVPGVDELDIKANEGVNNRKTKPNQRRFDDNRVSSTRGGGNRNQRGNRGRNQQPTVKKKNR